MRKASRALDALLILLILTSLATKDAKAYLDPGSSSYLIQILFASGFTVALAVKTFWKRVVFIFRRIFGRDEKKEHSA